MSSQPATREKEIRAWNGWLMFAVNLALVRDRDRRRHFRAGGGGGGRTAHPG